MLGLCEKECTIVVLKPDLLLADPSREDEVLENLQAKNLTTRQRKRVYLDDIDADIFITNALPLSEREALKKEFTSGPIEVLAVENIDDNAVESAKEWQGKLPEDLKNSVYASMSKWEAMNDLNFFFPMSEHCVERTFAMIKPDVGQQCGAVEEIIVAIQKQGLYIVGRRDFRMTEEMAAQLYAEHEGKAFYDGLMKFITSEPGVVALCLEGPQATEKWRLLAGPTNSEYAREVAPNTLRARYGTDGQRNAVHGSDSLESANRELSIAFPLESMRINRTLCLIKPDALKHEETIIKMFHDAEFHIIKHRRVHLNSVRAREFLKYFDTVAELSSMVQHITSGPVAVLILTRLSAIDVALQVAGPRDRQEAVSQAPTSIRAKFARDGIRDAVHVSADADAADREMRFFFPELGVDEWEMDDEKMRDYLFRKSAIASMDLPDVSDPGDNGIVVEKTFQQLLAEGFQALCKVQQTGDDAIEWLADWLLTNNPNRPEVQPPEISTKISSDTVERIIGQGVTEEGMAFKVSELEKPTVVHNVDVSLEKGEERVSIFEIPPVVVFVIGGPGSGKGTQCERLCQEFNFCHLSTGDLLRKEEAAKTPLGLEISKTMAAGGLVSIATTTSLLRNAMKANTACNRFLVDGFPRNVDQALLFEQTIAKASFVLYFKCSDECMTTRLLERGKTSGRLDDNEEAIKKRLCTFHEISEPVCKVYGPTGRLREINSDRSIEEVYADARKLFETRFIYLAGPQGFPLNSVAANICEKYGFIKVDALSLFRDYVKAHKNTPEAQEIQDSLASGKPAQASIACPIVMGYIRPFLRCHGQTSFVFVGFPTSVKQLHFLQHKMPSVSTAIVYDVSHADSIDISLSFGIPLPQAEIMVHSFQQVVNANTFDGCNKVVKATVTHVRKFHHQPLSKAQQHEEIIHILTANASKGIELTCTLVISPPTAVAFQFAQKWAERSGSACVDVDALLDSHLERKTDLGIQMHDVLVKGQVIPLQMILKMIKSCYTVTPTTHAVLFNFPAHVDSCPKLQDNLTVDHAFALMHDHAVTQREVANYRRGTDNESTTAVQFWSKCEQVVPLRNEFAVKGRARVINVNENTTAEDIFTAAEKAIGAEFVVFSGLPFSRVEDYASQVSGLTVTLDGLIEFAQKELSADVEGRELATDELMQFLNTYIRRFPSSRYVLVNLPRNAADAAYFADTTQKYAVGAPRACFYISVTNQVLADRAAEAQGEEFDAEQFETQLGELTPVVESLVSQWNNYYATIEDNMDEVTRRLLPSVYLLVAPSGKNFCHKMCEAICSASSVPLCKIDAALLTDLGSYSSKTEEELAQALRSGCVGVGLRERLFKEAFQKSDCNTILLTNVDCSGDLSLRDQLDVLEKVAQVKGVIHCSFEREEETGEMRSTPALVKLSDDDIDVVRRANAIMEYAYQEYPANRILVWSADEEEWSNVEEAGQSLAKAFLKHFFNSDY